MKRMGLILFLLFTTQILSCAGLAVGTYGRNISVSTNFNLGSERNVYWIVGSNREYKYTENEIIKAWGEPDYIKQDGNCDVYIYKNGASKSGVGAFIGIAPVPLLKSNGNNHNQIYILNGKSVGLVVEYDEVKKAFGFMCGSNECSKAAGNVNRKNTNIYEKTKIRKACI